MLNSQGAVSLGTKCSTPSEDEELDDQNDDMEYSSDGWAYFEVVHVMDGKSHIYDQV